MPRIRDTRDIPEYLTAREIQELKKILRDLKKRKRTAKAVSASEAIRILNGRSRLKKYL